LENLSDSEDINRAWENSKENIKFSAKESLGLHALKQGSRLKCRWYRMQAKAMYIISTIHDVKLADISGTKRRNI